MDGDYFKSKIGALQIGILILSGFAVCINGWAFEFPRVLVLFLFQCESLAIFVIFLILIIGRSMELTKDLEIFVMILCLMHVVLYLPISIAAIIIFAGNKIFGFNSTVWGDDQRFGSIVAGIIGILTCVALILHLVVIYKNYNKVMPPKPVVTE